MTIVNGAAPGKVGAGKSGWRHQLVPAQLTQSLTITETRSDQYITFADLPNKTTLDADFNLSAVSKRLITMQLLVLRLPTPVPTRLWPA